MSDWADKIAKDIVYYPDSESGIPAWTDISSALRKAKADGLRFVATTFENEIDNVDLKVIVAPIIIGLRKEADKIERGEL